MVFKNGESPEIILSTENLEKKYYSKAVVDDLSLDIHHSSFFGLIGPNGAGKTTTVNMLTDVIEPTSGRIELFGMDLKTHPIDIKKRIGVVPEDLALFEQLRAEEQLYLVGRIYGLDRDTVKTRADELMEVFDLKNARNRFVYELSTGMKKKLALMCALIHDPDLLFLDEPFQGIDAISSRLIQDNLCQLIHHGTTIFLTSHNLDLVQKLCTEVAIIHQGRIVLQGATKTIHDQLESTLQDADPDLESVFLKLVAPTYKPKLLSWIQTPG